MLLPSTISSAPYEILHAATAFYNFKLIHIFLSLQRGSQQYLNAPRRQLGQVYYVL